MKKAQLLGTLHACIFILISTATPAELTDNGCGLIYDSALDITWAQPDTLRFWDGVDTWVSGLTLGGASDWRLPYISKAAGAGPFAGPPVDCNAVSEAICRDNELGYMYYHNLGGTLGNSILTSGHPDLALFPSLDASGYWSGTEIDASDQWAFNYNGAYQGARYRGDLALSWAVHDGEVGADTLVTSELRITSSPAFETTPTLGNDGTTDLAVFTIREVIPSGALGPGEIYYQPLANGAPSDFPVRVTNSPTDDQLNDVSGDHIVYTAYDSTTSNSGSIMAYQISTGEVHTLGTSSVILEPKIHGNRVVWREGTRFSATVMYFQLDWIGLGYTPIVLAGPTPPTFDVQIGDRFAVWAEQGHSYDVWAYDFVTGATLQITDTAAINETAPATSGDWIVWEQDGTSIEAKNMETGERITLDNGASNLNPTIDGDLISWETDVEGNLDVWVYRISEGDSFPVTTDPDDQYLNDVFGNMVAYVDMRGGVSEDVYISTLEFVQGNLPPLANAGLDQTVYVGSVVSLNGGGSTDPDEDQLTYQWTLWFGSTEITEALSDPTAVGPTFTADQVGEDYHAELVVTDCQGLSSLPDTVVISTTNTAPVADAGLDQVVDLVGTHVTLDGSQSYDDDGHSLTYAWTLVRRPAGSSAVLSEPDTPHPGFDADVNGEYEATLVVNDRYANSDPDSVLVSFANIAPVADAGGNQAVSKGARVTLAGNGTDANNDPLTYRWSFVSKPAGSAAMLQGADSETAYFDADVAGTYVVSLVVNDGIVDSEPDNATIVVTTAQNQVIDKLREAIGVINGLPTDNFKNRNMASPLTNKLLAVITKIEDGEFEQAYDKLVHDVLVKMDGCAETGTPDRNDWITSCAAQAEVYPLIMEALALLDELLGG